MTIFKKLSVCCIFILASIFLTISIANAALTGLMCVTNNLADEITVSGQTATNPTVDFYIRSEGGQDVSGTSGDFFGKGTRKCVPFGGNPYDVSIHYSYQLAGGSYVHEYLSAKDASGWGDIAATGMGNALVQINFNSDGSLNLTVN